MNAVDIVKQIAEAYLSQSGSPNRPQLNDEQHQFCNRVAYLFEPEFNKLYKVIWNLLSQTEFSKL